VDSFNDVSAVISTDENPYPGTMPDTKRAITKTIEARPYDSWRQCNRRGRGQEPCRQVTLEIGKRD